MSLIRSKNGLANMRIFHKCDLVIYLEGGSNNFSYEEVLRRKYNKNSSDIEFWKPLIES